MCEVFVRDYCLCCLVCVEVGVVVGYGLGS